MIGPDDGKESGTHSTECTDWISKFQPYPTLEFQRVPSTLNLQLSFLIRQSLISVECWLPLSQLI